MTSLLALLAYMVHWCSLIYRIAGIFRRKLSRIGGKMKFRGENFRGLLACTAYIIHVLSTEPSNECGENFR